jgi:WXG100 family type VII secretion target
MSMMGMDVEVIRGVAQQLTAQADEIQTVITAVDAQIADADTNWDGDDATAFIDQWNNAQKPGLTQAEDALRQLATKATTQADQQEQTSAS